MLIKRIIVFVVALTMVNLLAAQCENWVGSKLQEDAENAHSIYRQALKTEDYTLALQYWKQAYEIAPAADGHRDYHYTDGVDLYKYLYKNSTDPAEKEEYKNTIFRLYDEAIACYRNKAITPDCQTEECYNEKIGYLLGRKGYDMFYELQIPYARNLEVLKEAIEVGKNSCEYIVFYPIAYIVVERFKAEKMTAEEARYYHITCNDIADYNIANNQTFGMYYEQAKQAMNGIFAQIEGDIFDCEFFKDKYEPQYEGNSQDPELIRKILSILRKQGCSDDDEFVKELDIAWKKYATEKNAEITAELEKQNPALAGNRLIREEKFEEAAKKYEEAIDQEKDPGLKADYLYTLATIQFGHLNQYFSARSNARRAASLKPGWGKPYLLIGDMYAKTARSCGDSWNQRLAVIAAIDQYAKAKAMDAESASKAQSRMNKLYGSLPNKDDAFMRGYKEGQTFKVGCWIDETVSLRFGN